MADNDKLNKKRWDSEIRKLQNKLIVFENTVLPRLKKGECECAGLDDFIFELGQINKKLEKISLEGEGEQILVDIADMLKPDAYLPCTIHSVWDNSLDDSHCEICKVTGVDLNEDRDWKSGSPLYSVEIKVNSIGYHHPEKPFDKVEYWRNEKAKLTCKDLAYLKRIHSLVKEWVTPEKQKEYKEKFDNFFEQMKNE